MFGLGRISTVNKKLVKEWQKLEDQKEEKNRVVAEKQKNIDELEQKLAAAPITVDLSKVTLAAEALALVPQNVAVENNVLPLSMGGILGDILVLAMENPGDLSLIDNISSLSRKRIRPVLPIGSLSKAIQKAYGINPTTPTPTPVQTPATPATPVVPPVKELKDMSTDELRKLAQEKKTIVEILREEKRNPGGATEAVVAKTRTPQTVEEAWKVVDGWRRESFLKQIATAESDAEKIIHPPATPVPPKKEPEVNSCTTCGGPVNAPRKICFFCDGKAKIPVAKLPVTIIAPPVILKEETVVVGESDALPLKNNNRKQRRDAEKLAKKNGGKGKGKPEAAEDD